MFDTIELLDQLRNFQPADCRLPDFMEADCRLPDFMEDELSDQRIPDPDLEDVLPLLAANQRRINQLEAQNALLVAQADEAGLPAREGCSSATALLKALLAVRGGRAQRLVGRRWLNHMPIVREAFMAGWLTVDQVDELLRAFNADASLFVEHEAVLVAIALETPLVSELAEAIERYVQSVAPADVVEDKAVQFEARGAYIRSTPTGMGVLTWYERLDVINRAREQLQANAPTAGDGRTSAQLMSDTLTDLVLGGGGANTRMVVHVDEAVLRYHVGGRAHDRQGASLTIDEVRRLACETQLGRHVYGPESVTTDLGRTRRVVSKRQRDLLDVRDRGCRFPGCDRPPHWCDAHHIRHWVDGGLTDLANLVLLCRFHHTLVHEQGWGLTGTPEHLTISRPTGEFHAESTLVPPAAWPQTFPEPVCFRLPPESRSEYFRYRHQALGWARKGIGERPVPLDTMPELVGNGARNARGSP